MSERKLPIHLVIFDMDGVLDRYDLNARLARLSAVTGKSADAIHAAIWKSGFEDAADAGKLSALEYLEGFGARIGAPLSRQDWIAARRAAMHPNRDVLALAEELKRRTGIAVLTNNGFLVKESFDQLFPELPPLFGEKLHVAADERQIRRGRAHGDQFGIQPFTRVVSVHLGCEKRKHRNRVAGNRDPNFSCLRLGGGSRDQHRN